LFVAILEGRKEDMSKSLIPGGLEDFVDGKTEEHEPADPAGTVPLKREIAEAAEEANKPEAPPPAAASSTRLLPGGSSLLFVVMLFVIVFSLFMCLERENFASVVLALGCGAIAALSIVWVRMAYQTDEDVNPILNAVLLAVFAQSLLVSSHVFVGWDSDAWYVDGKSNLSGGTLWGWWWSDVQHLPRNFDLDVNFKTESADGDPILGKAKTQMHLGHDADRFAAMMEDGDDRVSVHKRLEDEFRDLLIAEYKSEPTSGYRGQSVLEYDLDDEANADIQEWLNANNMEWDGKVRLEKVRSPISGE
jgi:hypothetical protein